MTNQANIIIPNPTRLAEIKAGFKASGAAKIHILADFDRTVTRSFVNGKRLSSLISVLRDEGYLTPDYPLKAQALSDKYGPLEIDLRLSPEERKKAMAAWWREHFNLLIESGLTKKEIAQVIKDSGVVLRPGAAEFFALLKQNDIPLVFLSATGLGKECIDRFMAQNNLLYPNIDIISNEFIWDKSGRMIGVKEPIIHIANKDETLIKDFPCYPKVKDRPNVIIVGDSVDDIAMVEGFNYQNLVKFGFLNEKIEENLPYYQEAYDVIILNDGPFDYLNEFLAEVV